MLRARYAYCFLVHLRLTTSAVLAAPITADMTLAQRGIWLVFVLLPSLLLLLPTSKAVLVWAGAFFQQALLQTWSDKLSLGHISLGPLGQVLPPVLSGCLAGERELILFTHKCM
jgi:hypothetical protein